MASVPLSYNLRSLWVRKSATLLTVISIGATVAVVAGVLALQQGFETLFSTSGSESVEVFLRPGATSEGESSFTRDRAQVLIKTSPEIAEDEGGRPLAAGEIFLAVRRHKLEGGETNVPIRGVEDMTFAIHGESLRMVEGRRFQPGSDEVIVGSALPGRIQGCAIGQTVQLNVVPFKVVGVFDSDGPYSSEIWGDVERMSAALELPGYSRVIAKLRPDVDHAALVERLESDNQVPAKALSERDYLSSQTAAFSTTLKVLAFVLAMIMGVAAVFTAVNTMLAAVASRSHEIGILLSLGYRPFSIFLSFLFESLVLGLLGGAVGVGLALMVNGIETGTTNFQTFTEVAFAFKVTPSVLVQAVVFAVTLGLVGGAWPALRAARMRPIEALRRG